MEFAGKAAHSSQPELGVNAVTQLGRLLAGDQERASAVRARGGDLMVTVVGGGVSPFVIPDRAQCVVERRTTPEESAAAALDEVRALLDPGGGVAELVAHREGWRLDARGPAADLAAGLGAALGTAATFDAPYWMEAPLWQPICPTVICGPSGGGLHAVDEWVDVGQVRAYAAALPRVLTAWAARARDGATHAD